MFHGVCRDAYGEFMIQVNDDFLVRRGMCTSGAAHCVSVCKSLW